MKNAAKRSDTHRREYPAEKARQGEIILRRRWQRIVFIAGLVGILLLTLALQFMVRS